MLNFRRLKKDFSPAILKDGQTCFQNGSVESVKIINLTTGSLRLHCQVKGAFNNSYNCEIEIDRLESTTTDSDCNCPHDLDCLHLAAVIFYLEANLDALIVRFGKDNDLHEVGNVDNEELKTIEETIKTAESKEVARKGKEQKKELLDEYLSAADALGQSPFFLPEEDLPVDKAELAVLFNTAPEDPMLAPGAIELQLALRLPYRSKPLNIPNFEEFLETIHYNEPLYLGCKRYFFTLESFDPASAKLLELISIFARYPQKKGVERNLRIAQIEPENFGAILSEMYSIALQSNKSPLACSQDEEDETFEFPSLYNQTEEKSLNFSVGRAVIHFDLEFLKTPEPKLLINPIIFLGSKAYTLEEISLFECSKPGLMVGNTYYRFDDNIRRTHLKDLELMRTITIPEPLFGTFVENSLPELMRFAAVTNYEAIESFITLPNVEEVMAECDIGYLNGELEASVQFVYGDIKVPAAKSQVESEHITQFLTKDGILARDLTEEQKILEDLFQDFIYDPVTGVFTAKTDKKVVEFMTEVIPRNQHRVQFLCPENLLDQFIYDESSFTLKLKESDQVDMYEVDLKVDGDLNGITLSSLWECISSKKAFIELSKKTSTSKKKGKGTTSMTAQKILVLDLDLLTPLVQIFDEIGITELDDHKELRPLWSLASINEEQFKNLPVKFSMSKRLKEIQQQMLGNKSVKVRSVPEIIQATLRPYQIDGAEWLERLRSMHLNGILADDMGLGKTLQAIIVVTQNKIDNPKSVSLIVCPTSLIYNWAEEFSKFNSKLKTLTIDGTPVQRKKLIDTIEDYDVIITSYSLLQKDIDHYQDHPFAYTILDEAQHIKNRGTRNAKSVKMVKARHKLILTGTPIENSLDELWSLFDFLMPGLLSTYDRFVEKYIRSPSQDKTTNLEKLKQKVSPFILRRMKKDVLKELPPVSEIVYHCNLSQAQKDLYHSYAESARKELSQLVKKEGFDKVQIHVLATLTRLKQICCHPAIFAKESPEIGDSSKYDMLMELLQTLIEGKHKTVIFSQYTRMLKIMSEDLKKQGISFEYLDGSSKNRLDIVKRFNEDPNIPVFLVSLKAGGVGLNLVGADTVIHYDMWWNPAVENQATDRVHRIGQQNNVSSYKLVTLNTIEEKIMELQNRKKGLVKKVVSTDDEAISKLTWEEVLELLQT
ncbi:MAG: SNF2-related protein [Chlamydiota bacterium]|nr:SNF2-related protein [Chlamydiota bacterium]